MNAVIIVVYNQAIYLQKQIDLFRKYLVGEYDIIVADNSSDQLVSGIIANICEYNGVVYEKLDIGKHSPSVSHAKAIEYIQSQYYSSYSKIGFFDHDIFPVMQFTYEELLNSQPIAGVYQDRQNGAYKYMWPGCLIYDTRLVDLKSLKYMPCTVNGVGLDTGGELYYYLLTLDNPSYLIEEHIKNPYWKKTPYDFYSFIGSKFMHFINGSNWNNQKDNKERLETLFRILDEKTA